MKTKLLFLLIICCASIFSYAQQWGLYTLYAPINSTQTYLVDTDGVAFKTWASSSTQKTGFSVYLIPGDTLVRPVARTGNSFTGGGMTGEVQKVTWNGTVVWDFVYSSSTYCLHHDVCPMPNGNVLMTVYESKTATEATAAGCSTAMIIWSEKLIEVRPTGATTGTIVWEWKLWDHLCQNYSSTKPNYVTSISQNPQLMNINYNTSKDWIHMNGIDYNEALDQITFSSRTMNEIYVIDHSTTTAEAASHSGGNSGKGGDFLYRWGNPAAYGVTGTKVFNVVHDSHWIASDNPNYPNYLCGFNNGGGAGGKSCVDIISPPYNGSNYSYTPGQAMLPATYAYRHTSTYTSNSNGASQQLPNGNMLVCSSVSGVIYEINSAGTNIWSKTVSGAPANALRYSKCYVRGPIATAIASPTTITSGSSVSLSSSATSVTESSPVYTYTWSSGQSTSSTTVTPTLTTTYIVTITNGSLGCSDTASVTVTVTGGSTLAASASASPNAVCAGASTQLNVTASGGSEYSYSWSSNPAGFTSTTQNPTVTPTATTTYTVTVTSGTSTTTSSATVTVNPLPSIPVITQNASTLSSTAATSYQWYENGSVISGAISQSYNPLKNGDYTVKITDVNGCTAMSEIFSYVTSAIIENEFLKFFTVYPNPTNGVINIDVISSVKISCKVFIFDICGKVLLETNQITNIDLSAFESGIYYITILTSETKLNKKISLIK